MSSYQELISQREKLDQQIETAKAAEFDAVVNDIKRKMQIYGITCADLGIQLGKSNKLRPRVRVEHKYYNPANPEVNGSERGADWPDRAVAEARSSRDLEVWTGSPFK